MTRKRPPARLYKYQPFSDQALANLANAQLWFTAPIGFNDPFDCALPFFDLTELTDEDYARAYTLIKRLRPPSPVVEAHFFPGGVAGPEFRKLLAETAAHTTRENQRIQLEERGVACFCDKPLDIMMWSHYANGHRGFCLEFDGTVEPFRKALQVRYADEFHYVKPVDMLEPPVLDGENEPAILVATVLTKARCWEYEKEWRLLLMEANTAYPYPREALTAIHLGAAMPATDRERIAGLLRGTATKIHVVQRDDKSFTLRLDDVSS